MEYKKQSPNKALHEVVSHKCIEKDKKIEDKIQQVLEELEENGNPHNFDQVAKEVGLSPRSLAKSLKKNKTNSLSDQPLPTRIVSKRDRSKRSFK